MDNTLLELQQRLGTTFQPQNSIAELQEFRSNVAYSLEGDKLIGLALCETELKSLSIPREWQNLRYLNLSDNKQLQHLTFEDSLPLLEHLDVSDSQLTNLRIPDGCDQLRWLDVSRNQLQGEINFQGNLPALAYLDVSKNQLTRLELPSCPALRYLYTLDNQINFLALESDCKQLEIMNLKNNKLEALPSNLLDLEGLNTLYLHGNLLTDIPKDVIEGGEDFNAFEAVSSYLIGIKKSDLVYLHQAKMVLIGNGEVGKSSIKVKLLNKAAPLPKKKDRTPGLDIKTYTVENLPTQTTQLEQAINFDLNIWDFGGQGRYREVQQLFCSRKSLYLFVTSHDDQPIKEDYVGFEYWLSMVNAYSFDESDQKASPVIHVVNKIDEKQYFVNRAARQAQFKNVAQFVNISAKTLEDFSALENAIRKVLPKVNEDIFTNQFPQYWMDVKSVLEERRAENHMTYSEYLNICYSKKLDKSEAESWIRILDRIGTVIYFGKDQDLSDYIVLNPLWVKDGFCKVLDSDLVVNGKLLLQHLKHIWTDFEEEERTKLLAMMKAYKLCYEQTDTTGNVLLIVPSMLNNAPISLPAHLDAPTASIKFIYHPFIPAGTFNKLLVELHPLIFKNIMWKNHVLLYEPITNVYGHVWEDWEKKEICLDLYGDESQLKELYEKILTTLTKQKDTLVNTRYLEQLDFNVQALCAGIWHNKAVLSQLIGTPFPFIWDELHNKGKQFINQTVSKTSNQMEALQQLVANNNIAAAIEWLNQHAPNEDLKEEAAQIQRQFNDLGRAKRIGTLSRSEVNREQNQMADAILQLGRTFKTAANPPTGNDTRDEDNGGSGKSNKKISILFLASNPSGTGRLRLDKELREIEDSLGRANLRNAFELRQKWAVRTSDLRRSLLDETANIVHFSGHGLAERSASTDAARGLLLEEAADIYGGIILENASGTKQYVSGRALAGLLKLFSADLQCVLLNSCYSEKQAKALIEHVPYVIGMSHSIDDRAAIIFATAFYDALGAGRTIEFAVELAQSAIEIEGLKGADQVQLLTNKALIESRNGSNNV